MSFLVLEGLQKRYGDVVAVAELSLTMEEGEFVALLGPSGCGKSTTLQMIAGFADPTRGAIAMQGRDLTGVPAHRRGIGIVFQSYALFPHMTVAENVAFGLEMRRVPRSERRQRVQAALDLIHLGGLGGRYPRQLSGGQQQRVALARALVIEPTLLLLDEPMSNLDAKLREDMQIELRQLQRALGITTILVTHDQSEAMALADRIAVMNSGRIVQIDTPNRAYEQPVDHFTSTFLGKSNAFRTRIASIEDGTAWVSAGDVVFGVDAQALRGAGEGSEVTCIVRPERITVRAAGEGIIDGSVRAAIFLGNHWLLKLETQLGDVLVFLQNVGGAVPEEGALIGLDWPPASVRVLERGETDECV